MYELIEGFEWVKTQVITLKDCPSCYVTMNHRVKISWKLRGVEKHICSFASWILSKDPRHYNDRKQSIDSKEATTVRISSLGKAVEYKVMNAISTHKIQLCLCISNKQSENKITKPIFNYNSTQKNKIFSSNFKQGDERLICWKWQNI